MLSLAVCGRKQKDDDHMWESHAAGDSGKAGDCGVAGEWSGGEKVGGDGNDVTRIGWGTR